MNKIIIKVPFLTALLLLTMVELASAGATNTLNTPNTKDAYGPQPPTGFIALQISVLKDTASRWWSGLKEKFVSEPHQAISEQIAKQEPTKTLAPPQESGFFEAISKKFAAKLHSSASGVGSVIIEHTMTLPGTNLHLQIAEVPNFVPRAKLSVPQVTPLPGGDLASGAGLSYKARYAIPANAYEEIKLPKNMLVKSFSLLAFNEDPLTKVERLPDDTYKLVYGLMKWVIPPPDKVDRTDEVMTTIYGLVAESKSTLMHEKALAFTGWLLEDKGYKGLASLSFARALAATKKQESIDYDNAATLALSKLARDTQLAREFVPLSAFERIKTLKPEAQAYLELLQAERAYEKGLYALARKHAQAVPAKTSWKEQARYLASSSLFAQGENVENYQLAGRELTELFRTVEEPAVFDVTAVTLGRIHFLLGNYKAANQYLSQVSRDTNLFVEAAVDNAWALLRSGDRNKAVGNMFTLHTPYFDGAYMPESYFLQSLGYQEICQFGDAMTAVKQYKVKYNEAFKKLIDFNAGTKALETAYYDDLTSYLKGKDHKLAGIVLREMGRHPEFLKRQQTLNTFAREERTVNEKFPVNGAKLVFWAQDSFNQVRDAYKHDIFKFVKKRALAMEEELKFLTANISLLEYEIFAGAGNNLSLQGAQNFAVDDKGPKRNYEDGKEYWPYEDEIWEDELNNFRSKMVDGCAKVKKAG